MSVNQNRPTGMPSDEAIRELAETWLKLQKELWPEGMSAILPDEASEPRFVVDMVESFRTRYLSEALLPVPVAMAEETAATYLRYSDANSNPRSLPQQLMNGLRRAKQDGFFIPWEYVFADAAITGRVASRVGYRACKALVESGATVKRLYVDELSRLCRDAAEMMILSRLVERQRWTLIGVSDGIDTSLPHSRLSVSLFGALNEQASRDKAHRVRRGMKDAFLQGKVVNQPCFGYRLVAKQDANGDPVINAKGKVEYVLDIDPEDGKLVREIYRRFAIDREDRPSLFRDLNLRGIDGGSWDDSRLRQLLKRTIYRGVEHFGMTSQVRDPETGKVTVIHHDSEDWLRRETPEARLVDDEMWQAAQDRLQESSEAFQTVRSSAGAGDRMKARPTRLFHLTCGCCGHPLYLGRSGKYSALCCLNGRDGKKGCTFRGYKSLSIVEGTLAEHLRANVFTESFVKQIAEEANRILKTMPEPDDSALSLVRDQIKDTQKRLAKLRKQLSTGDLSHIETLASVAAATEAQVGQLKRREQLLLSQRTVEPLRVDDAAVARMLDDLHGLLSEEVEAAAPIIRAILGEIVVQQVDMEDFKKPQWIARFTLNGQAISAFLTRSKDCPNRALSEFPDNAVWTIGPMHEVWCRQVPKYEQISQEALRLKEERCSIQEIAERKGVIWKDAQAAIRFAEAGKRPEPERPRGRDRGNSAGPKQEPKYKRMSGDVVRQRDVDHLSFKAIARQLGISPGTAVRAYDFGKTQMKGPRVSTDRDRGRYFRIPPEKRLCVDDLLNCATPVSEIVQCTGVSASSVYRLRRARS